MQLVNFCGFSTAGHSRSFQFYYEPSVNFYEKFSYDTLNEPFSAVLEIFDLSQKISATEDLKYFTGVEGERQQSLETPHRSARFLVRNFLDCQFELEIPHPSKIPSPCCNQ